MKRDNKQNKKYSDLSINLKNGIEVRPVIDMTVERPVLSFFPLVQFLIAALSSLSVIYMLPAFLDWKGGSYEITNSASVITTVILTTAAALLSTCKDKFPKLIGASFLIIISLYLMPNISESVNGFMYTVNAYTKRAGFSEPLFVQASSGVSRGDLEMFLLTFSFLTTILVSFGCIFHINFPLEFLATFPLFELGTFWGWEPYTWSTMGILFSWIAVLCINLINHTAKHKRSDAVFSIHKRKKAFYMTSERIKQAFFGLMSSAILITSLIVFIAVTACTMMSDSIRPASFKQLRYDLSNGFKNVSENITERAEFISSPLPGRKKMMGGTNGGKLGLYDKITFTGKTALKIDTGEFSRSIYLRGYAAEEYADNTWSPIKKNDDISAFFSDRGAQILDFDYIQDVYYPQSESLRTDITVIPVNCSSDVIYAPYGSLYSQIEAADKQKYDGMVSPKKKQQNDSYSISGTSLASDTLSWEDVLLQQFSRSVTGRFYDGFSAYSDFVMGSEDYRSVPKAAVDQLDKVISDSGVYSDMDYADIQTSFRKYFSENGYTYDLEPGVTPEGEDFVSYFLGTQKKGYCTYYASAAVLLMRRLGIPARYVEGYIVEPQQYSSEKGSISVSDRCAHAWCEIFIYGCGWFPIELTPGYEIQNPNLTDAEKNIKKPQPRKSQTVSSPTKNSSYAVSSSESRVQSSSDKDLSQTESSSLASSELSSSQKSGAGGTGSGGSDGHAAESGGSAIDTRQLAYMLLIAAFFAMAAVTAAVRRKHILKQIEKVTNSDDDRQAVIGCYTAFLSYMKLLDIDPEDNLTDVQLAAKISKTLKEKMPELSGPFLELSDVALSAYMSDRDIPAEESAKSRSTLKEMRRKLYDLMGFFRRFKAKWISGLY